MTLELRTFHVRTVEFGPHTLTLIAKGQVH